METEHAGEAGLDVLVTSIELDVLVKRIELTSDVQKLVRAAIKMLDFEDRNAAIVNIKEALAVLEKMSQ